MALGPVRHNATDPALDEVLGLIHRNFADMEGRIDPPSSARHLDLEALQQDALVHEVWSYGPPPAACAIFKIVDDALYIGKVTVDTKLRRQGLAARLITLASERAKRHGVQRLTLQCRVELVENHATFKALNFVEIARTAHAGFPRPTSITFQRRLD